MLSIGIVGLPNVGKSTLFKALTRNPVDISNYPFCTIDPNVGVVRVPDARIDKLARQFNSKKVIPTVVEFHDIAGLVKNAAKGEGLGNAFLSHIRRTDAICEVVRCFASGDIVHVEGTVNPRRDIEIIHLELILADLDIAEKSLEKASSDAKSGKSEHIKRKTVLEKIVATLEKGKILSSFSWTEDEATTIKELGLLTTKPIIVAFNLAEDEIRAGKFEAIVKEQEDIFRTSFPDLAHVELAFIATKLELELSELPTTDAAEYRREFDISPAYKGIDALIKECKKRNLILAVGYVLRFHESLKILKKAIERGRIGRVLNVRASAGQSLLNWRPGADYRKGVSAQRELGGGIVFELSHEIDYCRWLMGEISEVSAIIDKQSDLAIDVEDVAEINLRFKNGVIGHIHLDMVDQARNRCCRIVGTKGTLAWDFMDNHSVKLCSIGQKRWVNLRKPQAIDANDMFCRQFGHFRQCIDSKKSPLVSGEDAKRVVEIILAAKKSARKGITVRV